MTEENFSAPFRRPYFLIIKKEKLVAKREFNNTTDKQAVSSKG